MSRRPQPNADKAAANQAMLKQLVKLEGNKSCADCKKNKHPRWASWNLGIFVCIRCSGIHRGMGTHISRVKSVDLDAWTDEQLQSVVRWGNTRANKYWEAKLAPGHVPAEAKIENFIRTKYESKRWVSDGPMPDPATLDSGDDDAPLAVVQEKAKLDRASSLRNPPVGAPAARRANNIDLFADDSNQPARPSTTEPIASARPPPVQAPSVSAQQKQQPPPKPAVKQGDSLLGLDFFGGTQSAPPPRPTSTPGSTGALPQRTDLKQSILSLYASAPKPAPAPQPPIQASAGINPQSTSGLDDAFSSLNFGAPQQAPAQIDSFAGLSSPAIRQSTTTSPPMLSGGSFFDAKPSVPAQTRSSAPRATRASSGFGDFGDFTSATPAAAVAKPAPPTTSTMGDLFDLSSAAPIPSTTVITATTPKATPAPVQQKPVVSKPAIGNPPPINMSSYTSNSAFNLSSSTPAAAVTKPAAPAPNYAAMNNVDAWGSNDAWGAPDPVPEKPAAPKATVAAATPKAPATTALSDSFGGWGSNDAAASAVAPVSGMSDDFGGWGSNDTVSPAKPAITQDDDFGGWSSASPVAVSSQPAASTASAQAPAPAPAPSPAPASKPFSGGRDDLFGNVWE